MTPPVDRSDGLKDNHRGCSALARRFGAPYPALLALAGAALALNPGVALAAQLPPSRGGAELPAPTGRYPVGRVARHWTDTSRADPFTADPTAPREMMVYVWYPAGGQRTQATAPYLSAFARIEQVLGDSAMKDEFGASYARVRDGMLATWSVDGAPLASAQARYPVLVFSHGFGETSLTYAAVLEDLASHGYVVFAIDHPHDAFCVIFPDGRAVPFDQAQWDAAIKRPGGAVAYQVAQVSIRAADMRYAIDRIMELARASRDSGLFAGRLDSLRIGTFGHSLGGLAAARTCELDLRPRACMNQDADLRGLPFILSSPGGRITQPFLFFASQHSLYVSDHITPPSDSDLVSMLLTRAQYTDTLRKYQGIQDSALAAMPGGSYLVAAEPAGFTHRSFMDLRLLTQGDDSAATARNRYNLALVRAYTRAFFDKYLRDGTGTVLDQPTTLDPAVRVRHFPPARSY